MLYPSLLRNAHCARPSSRVPRLAGAGRRWLQRNNHCGGMCALTARKMPAE